MFTYRYNFLILTIEKHIFFFLFTFTTYTGTARYLIISKASEETAQSAICIYPKLSKDTPDLWKLHYDIASGNKIGIKIR